MTGKMRGGAMGALAGVALVALLAGVPEAARAAAPGQPGPQAAAAAASLGFVALEVAALEPARRFYTDGLGMKQALILSKPGDPFQKIGLNFTGDPASPGPLLILIHHDAPREPARTGRSATMVGLLVPDTHAAAARLRGHGYTVLREPAKDAPGPILTSIARDPDGNTVELAEMRGIPRP